MLLFKKLKGKTKEKNERNNPFDDLIHSSFTKLLLFEIRFLSLYYFFFVFLFENNNNDT